MPNPLSAAPLTVLRAIQHGVSTARYVPHFLSAPVTGEDAVADTRERISRRADAFLEVAERAIFAHSRSAYRPLLDAAGYDLPRLRALVGRRGGGEARHRGLPLQRADLPQPADPGGPARRLGRHARPGAVEHHSPGEPPHGGGAPRPGPGGVRAARSAGGPLAG